MESKLDALLNRLEGIVQQSEESVPQTQEQQIKKMESLVARLEVAQAAGGKVPAGAKEVLQQIKQPAAPAKSAPAQPQAAAPSGGSGNYDVKFKSEAFGKIDELMACCKVINNEGVTEAVNLYLEVFKSQSAVFGTMASCKKPDNMQFMCNIAKEKKNKMIALEKKNRKFMNHIRCVEDSLNLFAWFMIPNEEQEAFMAQLTDFYGAIDFMGTKLQNDENDKKWYRAFRAVQ